MSKYEQVILIIEDYIFDFTEPQRSWDKHWFKLVINDGLETNS